MPSNAIMNIMGGYIPKVRIERVSLSNGGKLIVEDNPHFVEQELNRQVDRATVEVHARNFLMAASDDEKRRLFQTEYDREVAKQTGIATQYRSSLIDADVAGASDLEISDLTEMFAIRNFLVEYGLKVVGDEPDAINTGMTFRSEPANDRRRDISFRLRKNAALTPRRWRWENWERSGDRLGIGVVNDGNRLQISRPDGVRDKVRVWIDQLTLPREQFHGVLRPPVTLNTIYSSTVTHEGWSQLIKPHPHYLRPYVVDATTAVLYVLVDRVLSRNRRQIEAALGIGSGRVITAQATTAESSGQMTVDLLLNVKNVVDSNGIYKSWLSKPGILDHLEFGIIETTNLDAIELARNSNTSGDTMETWLRTYGIGFRYDDAESFLSQDLAQRMDLTEPTLIEKMSLKAAMESNGMEEAIRNPQIDSDGNQVQTFTFRIQNTFAVQPSMLAYYIIPYLNVPKFITSLEASNEIELDMDTFLEYKDLFIGSMTRDLILKSGKIQGTKNVFSYMTSPTPPRRPERRLWEGSVKYWTQDSPATGGYVGWKTVGLGDGTEAQQRELLVEVVTNNTIQDFRTIERLEKTITDLTQLDAKAFTPEIKGISDNQEVELIDSYFGDLEISTDINGVVSLFCPFDMESLARRETLFGALWKNLSEDEKEELFNLITFHHIRLKRRHVRDVTAYNRMNGLSNDIPKIDEGDYEAPDTMLLSLGYPEAGTPLITDEASFKDLTMFARASDHTFGQTKFFTFKDKTANKLNSGQHQYGIELIIQDNTVTFFKNRRETLSTQLSDLKSYYNILMDNNLYDTRLDSIRPAAVGWVVNGMFRSWQIGGETPPRPTLPQDNPHIAENTANMARDSINPGDVVLGQTAAPTDRVRVFNTASNIEDLVSMFKSRTGTFIRTLQILNTSDNLIDVEVLEQTIDTFLSPATATRDTVNRFIKVVQDVIDKLDSLLGISSSPPKGHPSATSPSPSSRNATSKSITVEQYMTNLYDATIAPGSGYYYIRPRFHEEPLDTPGIRQITAANMIQSQQIELNKSFPGTEEPRLLRDFSYYTPLYATILNIASSNLAPILKLAPPDTPQGGLLTPFNVNRERVDRSDVLNHLPHWYNTNEYDPGWSSTMERYNMFVDMIRSLNLIKNTNQVAQGITSYPWQRDERRQGLAASIASDAQRSKKTLLSLFSHQGVTLIDRVPNLSQAQIHAAVSRGAGIAAPPAGGNGGFSPSIDTPAGGLNAAGQGVMGIGAGAPMNQAGLSDVARDLPPATNRDPIQEYLRSINSTVDASPNAILRNVLQSNSMTMGPVQFNHRVTDLSYRQFIASIIEEPLPISLYLLTKRAVARPPAFLEGPTTLNAELRDQNHGGIFDMHFNKVMELQVLVGFEEPGQRIGDGTFAEQSSGTVLVDRPIWRKFQKADLETNSICRLIPYDNSGIGVAHPSYLEMPVFDHIFLIEGSGGEDVG